MIRRYPLSYCLLLAVLVFAGVQHMFAWGVDGHQIINQLACSTLPADIPAFLRSPQAMNAMVYYAPMPDHWRGPWSQSSRPQHLQSISFS